MQPRCAQIESHNGNDAQEGVLQAQAIASPGVFESCHWRNGAIAWAGETDVSKTTDSTAVMKSALLRITISPSGVVAESGRRFHERPRPSEHIAVIIRIVDWEGNATLPAPLFSHGRY